MGRSLNKLLLLQGLHWTGPTSQIRLECFASPDLTKIRYKTYLYEKQQTLPSTESFLKVAEFFNTFIGVSRIPCLYTICLCEHFKAKFHVAVPRSRRY